MSEYVEIIDSVNNGAPIHPINKVLQANKDKNLSVLQILAKDSGCTIDTKYNFIIDCAGRLILPGQLMEAYGIMNSPVRCVICQDSLEWNTILAHLQDDFQNGHNLNTEKTIKIFSKEFWNWEYSDSRFTYRGEGIEAT